MKLGYHRVLVYQRGVFMYLRVCPAISTLFEILVLVSIAKIKVLNIKISNVKICLSFHIIYFD